ncbi:MAG: 4-vinyl reductase [Chloroflexota bacterium]
MMDKIIDQAWLALLASVVKKRVLLRPEMGDDIDLYLPQSRLLSLVESNPAMPKLLYASAQSSASRNAYNIVRKLGMPPDYFWKFEYWPRARALTNLSQIVKRVFSSMMVQAREGNPEITGLDIDPLRINLEFSDCVECSGLSGLSYGVCYYHAGTFAGILASLINRELSSIETDCLARGDKSCRFVIGDKQDAEIQAKQEAYLAPPEFKTELSSRLEKTLQNLPVRIIGDLVDINYYQLVLLNALLSDPEHLAASSFDVGCRVGRSLAPVLAKFYGREGLKNVIDYYAHLRQSRIEIKAEQPRLELEVKECAEATGTGQRLEITSFLSGELQGLISVTTGAEVTLEENRFEDDRLFLAFVPKA